MQIIKNRIDPNTHSYFIILLLSDPKTGVTQFNQSLSESPSWPAVILWAALLLKLSLWIEFQSSVSDLSLCQALCLWLLSRDRPSSETFRHWRYYNLPKGMHSSGEKCNTVCFLEGPNFSMGFGGRTGHIALHIVSLMHCVPLIFKGQKMSWMRILSQIFIIW